MIRFSILFLKLSFLFFFHSHPLIVAFGTMTNVSRYGNRNEEFRTEYYNKKLPGLERALFKKLSPQGRRANWERNNPFVKQLKSRFDEFVANAEYYGVDYEEIETKYNEMKHDNISHVQNFMNLICTHFIPIVYQKDIYLKDFLWQLHVACTEIVDVLSSPKGNNTEEQIAATKDMLIVSILGNMEEFSTRLAASLQTGPILFGFFRKGKTIGQSVLVAPIRDRLLKIGNILLPRSDQAGGWRPLATVIRDINARVYDLNEQYLDHGLKREARDLKELFHSTMESAHASAIYFVACGSFSFAILSTANNFFNATVEDENRLPQPVRRFQLFISQGSSIISIFAALYALEFLVKFFTRQRKVLKSVAKIPSEVGGCIRKVKRVAIAQSFITVLRILAALGTVVSLGTNFARLFVLSETPMEYFTRSQIQMGALVSLGGWILAIVLSFFVDFFLLWNLEPTTGYEICINFKSELVRIYNSYSGSTDDALDSVNREYTAREFVDKTRFDSVLRADRFVSNLQTILSKDFKLMNGEQEGTA